VNALRELQNRPSEDKSRLGFTNTVDEIAQQPGLWLETLGIVSALRAELGAFLGKNPALLLSGAGSSHFVGVSILPALKLAFDCVDAVPSTELLMDPETAFPRRPFILVSFARSGDSPEGNAVARLAESLRPGLVRQLAITCNAKGELAGIVRGLGDRGRVLLLPEASNDRSLAMTSSFSSMVLAGLSLAFLDRSSEYETLARSLATAAPGYLASISDLAKKLADEGFSRVFFLASRPFLGGAYEAHLKVQEMSGGAVIAKAEDTLGFRHGFMAAVDKESLIVLFRSSEAHRRRYEEDLLAEIAAKGLGRGLVVVDDNLDGSIDGLPGSCLGLACGNVGGDLGRSLVAAIFGQVLGLFLSLSLGFKPDNPSPSGVINRVVQGVRIYPYPGLGA
jgi:tagatose-6-phosphate ketose/aldose isomerase